MSASSVVLGRDHLGTFVVYEGRKAWRHIGTAADLAAEAVKAQQEAAEASYRARRARAMAALVADEERRSEAERRAARNAKAAATRAHNRNPFGFADLTKE